MEKELHKIAMEFSQHIAMCGGSPSEWYAGITSKEKDAIFEEHHLVDNKDIWFLKKINSTEDAFSIWEYLRNILHIDGKTNQEIERVQGTTVYIYKKMQYTNP